MSTVQAIEGLKRLAHDTARLACDHPCMKRARRSMNLVIATRRPDSDDWIDDVFSNVEVILADILRLER